MITYAKGDLVTLPGPTGHKWFYRIASIDHRGNLTLTSENWRGLTVRTGPQNSKLIKIEHGAANLSRHNQR